MKVCTLLGVDIIINKFTLLLILFFIFTGYFNEIIIMFIIVFIHEISHAIAAKIYRLNVSEIELLPVGGVVKIESFFQVAPGTEIGIALAGPLFNIIAASIFVGLDSYQIVSFNGMDFFIYGNILLGMFNLLPALPLDGGRVFRAVLHTGVGYKKATNIAVVFSKVVAVGLFLLGLYILIYKSNYNFIPLILSVYLFFESSKEKSITPYIYVKGLTSKRDRIRYNKMMAVRHIVLPDTVTLKDIINRFIPNKYHIVVIINGKGDIIGSIDESSLLKGILEYGLHASVRKLIFMKNKKEL